MNKIFKGLAIASLLAASSMASANGWNFGGGYANYMEDGDGADISLGVIYATAGYTYESGSMTFMPSLRLGTGISDDNVSIYGVNVNVEIDSLVVASIRGQYNVTEDFGVFLQPSYGRLEATASAGGFSETADDWEFGFGGGATFKVSETTSIEAIYESFDEADVFSAGIRMTF
ncbi:outer membrane beta-barrel protein [Aliiglaciecola sp. LCG003]|uniref:outer membrane beta-barrel protein n=1 Tax=Aliiglaciecola sp. LCG003 TaxID=3053655 RepID=UPI0025743DB6|nr:outer membrane beta-barrel protein [Aliiglaciecola sp. LCG003]WJG10497.1 outer membrane beta-barrel protein [Aliiglaciecola sp. LCG003]